MNPRRVLLATALLLLAPLASSAPSIQDPSTATVFVTSADTFTFANGQTVQGNSVGTTWTLTAPGGQTMQFTRTSTAASNTPPVFRLDGSLISGQNHWTATGSLIGAPADGTWQIQLQPTIYVSSDSNGQLAGRPGPTLTVGGKFIHWGAMTAAPVTWTQYWNWHSGASWNEPSNVPTECTAPCTADTPNEASQEDPNNALLFRTISGTSTPSAATGNSAVTCPSTVMLNGAWVRGGTQTGNTFVRFAVIPGNVPGDSDLRDNPTVTFTTLIDAGAGASGTRADAVTYNNAAGNTYQFMARAGASGLEQLGQPVFVAPMQCTITGANIINLLHDENEFQIAASQAQCNGDPTSFELTLFALGAGSGLGTMKVVIYNATTAVLEVQKTEMITVGTFPTQVFMFAKLLPPGPYVAIATADITGGVGINDYYDAVPFNVPLGNCNDAATNLAPVLIKLAEHDGNQTALYGNLTQFLGHVNQHLHFINATNLEILQAIENLNLTIIGNVTGNFTLDNATLSSILNQIIEHRTHSLELTMINDFSGLGFDGFLFFLFWVAAMLFFTYQRWLFAAGFSLPGLLDTLFPEQIPGDFSQYLALCLLGFLLEVAANRFGWGPYKTRTGVVN